jgi:micrococcal nuclease
MYEYTGTVKRVIDGDTVELMIDLGFHTHTLQTVRIAGIDAPEMKTPEGKLAKKYLQSLLPLGTLVKTVTEKPNSTEKYGRYLARIVRAYAYPQDEIGPIMIAAGHAKPYDGGART